MHNFGFHVKVFTSKDFVDLVFRIWSNGFGHNQYLFLYFVLNHSFLFEDNDSFLNHFLVETDSKLAFVEQEISA